MKHLLYCCVACLILAPCVSDAQMVGGRQIVSAELVEGRIGSDSSITIGIHFRIEPEWYLYWTNPGDAGLPISVQWILPEGWKAGPTKFPVPSKFVHGDIVAYGYKDEAVLLTTIVSPGAAQGVVRANLDWLVCRESCVRGKSTISLETDHLNAGTELIRAALKRMPESGRGLNIVLAPSVVRHVDEHWTCEVALEGADAASVSDFYPEINDDVALDYSSIRISGGRLRFTLSRENIAKNSVLISGLLFSHGKGYEYSFPIKFTSF